MIDVLKAFFLEAFHTALVVLWIKDVQSFFAEVNTLGVGLFRVCGEFTNAVR